MKHSKEYPSTLKEYQRPPNNSYNFQNVQKLTLNNRRSPSSLLPLINTVIHFSTLFQSPIFTRIINNNITPQIQPLIRNTLKIPSLLLLLVTNTTAPAPTALPPVPALTDLRQVDLDRLPGPGERPVVKLAEEGVAELVREAVARLQLLEDALVEPGGAMLAQDAVGEGKTVLGAFGDDAPTIAEGAFAFVVGDDEAVALGLIGAVHRAVDAVGEAQLLDFGGNFNLDT